MKTLYSLYRLTVPRVVCTLVGGGYEFCVFCGIRIVSAGLEECVRQISLGVRTKRLNNACLFEVRMSVVTFCILFPTLSRCLTGKLYSSEKWGLLLTLKILNVAFY